MTIDLHAPSALLDALLVGVNRPIAFLVGSPLSWDSSGGVPGVGGMIDVARAYVREKLPRRVADFDSVVGPGRTGSNYQAAMKWVHGSLTQGGVDEVIRRGVLQARRPGRTEVFQGDGVPADWHLPIGTAALGRLLASGDDRFVGPVLTTNFDPLVSLGIRAAGGVRRLRVIDSDGGLPRSIEIDPGEVDVVHLHGYWKGASTLHTPAQLTSSRPKLVGSLRGLLTRCALVVMGYGGWDDVFTAALGDAVQDIDADVTVLWCFRESDHTQIERDHRHLLDRIGGAITSGKVHLYGGIDCHQFLKELLREAIDQRGDAGADVELPGWLRVSREYLTSLSPLAREDALRYFDGSPPSWKHAGSAEIPRRHQVGQVMKALREVEADCCTVTLIRGAGGEGKSTVLMQCAADAARSGDWDVLYRASSTLGISAEVICALAANRQWLIVVDDADNATSSIFECIRQLRERSRANVDFLLASRDADWIEAHGDRLPWRQQCVRLPDCQLRGIEKDDALAIVEAWSIYGEPGLRGLNPLQGSELRAERLRDVARSLASNMRGDGSFFGALLEVRFSEPALREHVRVAIDRLQEVGIHGGRGSLADALFYIAACHSAGVKGLDLSVLADLLATPLTWVRTRVLGRLGEEVAVVAAGDAALTRHSRVADAIVAEAELSLGVDVGEVWSRLIEQVSRTSERTRVRYETHSRVLHISPSLQKSLPAAISEKRRGQIAIAAARASITAMPNRLDVFVDLAKALRVSGQHESAILHCQEHVSVAQRTVDYLTNFRGFVHEWAVCVGDGGKTEERIATNAWLAAYALSDQIGDLPISSRDLMKSCGALGLCFSRLVQSRASAVFERGRSATAWLGALAYPDARATEQFERDASYAKKAGVPPPKSVVQACEWIEGALQGLAPLVVKELTRPLELPTQIEFRMLQGAIASDFRTLLGRPKRKG